MSRTWLIVVVACVLVLAACSKSTPSGTSSASPSPTAAAAQTFNVSVDGTDANKATEFQLYFPATATVHPGDTISFKLVDNGEPHTVTFGTLVDAAVAESIQNPTATSTPADDKVPQLLPQGPGDAIQSAAAPCYLTSGAPPTSTACSAAQQSPQPAYQGSETYYNSGWLGPDAPFTMKLADSIKPGTYHYMCLLHRESMSGVITVVDKSQSVQSPSAQEQAGQTQLQQQIAALSPALGPLAQGQNPELTKSASNPHGVLPSGPTAVLAGSGLQAVQTGLIDLFGPSTVTTTVGGAVTWYVLGPHTISFNAPTDAVGAHVPNQPHLNMKAVAPTAGSAPPPPPNFSGNGPPTLGTIVNGGTFDGNGFHNSGLILSFPPTLYGYKVKFTKAGTYPYQCLIHFNMKGTVIVK
jgi:plastocyanin